MSVKVMSQVWEYSTAKGSTLLLLLAIADFAKDDGSSWPSIDTLAEKVRMTPRTVERLIRVLEEAGELSVIRHRGHRNSYQISSDKFSLVTNDHPRQKRHKRSDIAMSSGSDIAMSSDPSLTVIDPLTTATAPRADARETQELDELFGVREERPEDVRLPVFALQDCQFALDEGDFEWAQNTLQPCPTREQLEAATSEWITYQTEVAPQTLRTVGDWNHSWKSDMLRKLSRGWFNVRQNRRRGYSASHEGPLTHHPLLELRSKPAPVEASA